VSEIVGILPAAGIGQRLKPYNGPKELLSVGYHSVTVGMETKLMPMVVSQYSLNAMSCAGVHEIYFVLSTHKWEIAKFFMSGANFGVNCSYLCQDKQNGMVGALDVAYPWVRDKVVCMGMPDTVVSPTDCFAQLMQVHTKKSADLTLGIFPTDTPQSLAPVHVDIVSGRVIEIFDKPRTTSYFNTWGIAIWTPVFTELLHEYVKQCSKDTTRELLLSDVFSAAVKQGLKVYSEVFSNGRFFDIGTPEGLRQTRFILEYSG
jgi:glucose-1-phosphate thymidylyltransferase